jgi:TolB-like protein
MDLLKMNRELHQSLIKKYGGTWLKEMGDGTLAQFNSAIDSVRCAIEIQKTAGKDLKNRIRIGIHLGDVTAENGDVFGDGVNIASRLQAVADPGGIYISDSIEHAIRGNNDIKAEYLAAIQLKNVDYLVHVYFLVDEELPKPSDTKRNELSKGIHSSVFKSLYTYIILLLIVVVGVTSGLWIKNKIQAKIKAIAVLPAENIYDNEMKEWLAAGIHQGLIDELSKIHAFRVISRKSSMKYFDTDMTIPDIAKDLDVDAVVTPSFTSSEDHLILQVRLIQAFPKESQIWGETYERTMQNVLSIYTDIAKSVARASNIALSPDEEVYLSGNGEVNPKAYEAYLRGMGHVENATEADLDKALHYFHLALEIEPEYALAYCGIYFAWVSYRQHGFKPRSESNPKAQEAIRKAYEIDSTLLEVQFWKAIQPMYAWDREREDADRRFLNILEINPNYGKALVYYAHYLAITGRPVDGLEYSYRACKVDPYDPLVQAIHGFNLKNARKYDEALEVLSKLLNTNPDQTIALPALWAVHHEKGNFNEALEVAKKIYQIRGNDLALQALEAGNKEGGYKMAMQRTAEMMIAYRDTVFFPAWQISTLYTRADLKEEALNWLWKSYEEHDGNMPVINVDPLFDNLRDEPRFKDLLHTMSFPVD